MILELFSFAHLFTRLSPGLLDVTVVHHVELLTVFLAAGAGQGGEQQGRLVTGLITRVAWQMRTLEGRQHCG